jgi:hypothetical protein
MHYRIAQSSHSHSHSHSHRGMRHVCHRLGQDSIHRRVQNHPNTVISIQVYKQTSVSGRSAESAAFLSEFCGLRKNPGDPSHVKGP